MSIVAAFRADGRVLMVADSAAKQGDTYVSSEAKLARCGDILYGCVGSAADKYQILGQHNVAQLLEPVVALRAFQEYAALLEASKDTISFGLVAAKGITIWQLNDQGHVWDAGEFVAAGTGFSVGNYLLHKHWRPGLTKDEAEALALWLVDEVVLVESGVRPPAVILWT